VIPGNPWQTLAGRHAIAYSLPATSDRQKMRRRSSMSEGRDFDEYSEKPRRREFDDDAGRDDHGERSIRREDVPNYLVQSILVTLFCCLIGGIIAIINAAQVNGKLAAGDVEGARRASDQARKWCWISLVVGIILQPAIIILQIVAQSATKQGFR
jgi:hypothetical protein